MRDYRSVCKHISQQNKKFTVATIATLAVISLASCAQAGELSGSNNDAGWIFQDFPSYGFHIEDAYLPGQGDVFDSGLVTSVNGVVTSATSIGSVTSTALGQSVTGVGTVSGLNFSKTFLAYSNLPILRTAISFTNPTASTVSFDFLLESNIGSDSFTQIIGSSSGDQTFTTADNYVITDDDELASGDPANTHVLYTPGALAPDIIRMNTLFIDTGDEGISAQFSNLSLGAGETATFLFFNRIDTSAANASAYASTFASAASITQAGLVNDMTPAQLGTVRNFGSAVVPEAGTVALLGTGVLPLIGAAVRKRRK